MKHLVLFLSLFLLIGCTVAPDNRSTSIEIISNDESRVLIRDKTIYIIEGMKVAEVIGLIESIDGSKQSYLGVTNDRSPKQTDTFNRYEFLLVTSEKGTERSYYAIIFFGDEEAQE